MKFDLDFDFEVSHMLILLFIVATGVGLIVEGNLKFIPLGFIVLIPQGRILIKVFEKASKLKIFYFIANECQIILVALLYVAIISLA